MAPRKAAAKTVAPGEQTTTPPSSAPQLTEAADAAITQEHREDMIANGIVAAEVPSTPSTKKTKTTPPKGKRKATDDDPSESATETPSKSNDTTKPPAKKRKSSTRASSSQSASSERKADSNEGTEVPSADSKDVEKHATPPKQRKKAVPKKRKADPRPPDDANNLGSQAADMEAPPAKSTRKRKADQAAVNKAAADDNATSATEPPPKKRKKRGADVSTKPGAPPPSIQVTRPTPDPPTRINKAVANKVKEVLTFVENYAESESVLARDPENKDVISVPESAILGAVMVMRIHYEVGSPDDALVSEVEEAIVGRFQDRIGEGKHLENWVTIDATKQTKFEEAIHEKIARHGLDDVNLLEIELELRKRDQLGWSKLPKEKMSSPEVLLRTFEEIWVRLPKHSNPFGGLDMPSVAIRHLLRV